MTRILKRFLPGFPALALVCGCAALQGEKRSGPVEFDAGPLASRVVEDDGTIRERALGPFWERTRGPNGAFSAFRPLAARVEDTGSGWVRCEAAWPLVSGKWLNGRQATWRVALAYYQRFYPEEPNGRWRFWLLPVYFQGRDATGHRYAALFPLGGRIHEILGQDEVVFALFPLWLRVRVDDIKTTGALWPVLSRTEGDGISRWRVFPLYGESRARDRYAKRFILWPFWTEARYFYPQSTGTGFVFFPFYGQIRLTDQRSDLFFPPFIRVDRAEQIRSVTAPWPFIRVQSGKTNEVAFWPLFRARRRPGMADGYCLWPIFGFERVDRGEQLIRRWNAWPVVQTETQTPREPTGSDESFSVTARKVRIWPLAEYRREKTRSRFRLPAFWPTSNPGPVERNWAPLWTLFERTADGKSRDTEILWGLVRDRVRPGGERYTSLFPLVERAQSPSGERRWTFVKGLVEIRRRDTLRAVRFLYFFTWSRAGDES